MVEVKANALEQTARPETIIRSCRKIPSATGELMSAFHPIPAVTAPKSAFDPLQT